jgi:hypothetical protein
MADPERIVKLRALLVRLRSVGEVDTISVGDRTSVDGMFDAVKDLISVTHRTVAVSCTELLNVCGDEPFRTDLRLLWSVLERVEDKASKSRNVGLAGLLWGRMKPALITFHRTLRSGSVKDRVMNKLDDQMKAYRNKHMLDFDKGYNDQYNTELLRSLPDIKTIPN